jgi:hypothetical protein
MSNAPIAKFYADLKRLQKDLKRQDVENQRDKIFEEMTQKYGGKLRKSLDAQVRERERRRQKAREAISKTQEALKVSIETEALYRRDKQETRRRQQEKNGEGAH